MHLETPRLVLRDFNTSDHQAFVNYQQDPRYRALYDIVEGDRSVALSLLQLFEQWRSEQPRSKYQLGIFERSNGELLGSGGIRLKQESTTAVIGLELAPQYWGRYGIAIEAGERLAQFAFEDFGALVLVSDTSSGNHRVSKLAARYGARLIAERPGPRWMAARGWTEVDWALSREEWLKRPRLL